VKAAITRLAQPGTRSQGDQGLANSLNLPQWTESISPSRVRRSERVPRGAAPANRACHHRIPPTASGRNRSSKGRCHCRRPSSNRSTRRRASARRSRRSGYSGGSPPDSLRRRRRLEGAPSPERESCSAPSRSGNAAGGLRRTAPGSTAHGTAAIRSPSFTSPPDDGSFVHRSRRLQVMEPLRWLGDRAICPYPSAIVGAACDRGAGRLFDVTPISSVFSKLRTRQTETAPGLASAGSADGGRDRAVVSPVVAAPDLAYASDRSREVHRP
jgi:hypothetical protein